jgi:deferrochelatase/peroxidase EfeB
MNKSDRRENGPSRRGLLTRAGGLIALAAAADGAHAAERPAADPKDRIGFWGPRQAGITTPQQSHTYFMAFDLIATKRADVSDLLRVWTEVAARLTAGLAAPAFELKTLPAQAGYDAPAPDAEAAETSVADTNDAQGLSPARLTITFGFGPGLFVKDGADRYGLADQRPEALIDLPRFNGDQLVPAATGGDLSVQACADDPQVAFHAVRQLAARAYGVADVRWAQSGFLSRPANGDTPRNLMGFKDGTQQPAATEKVVWVGDEGPAWLRGGSYLVTRRIRMAIEHWDRTNVGFQEQTMGRHKVSGAPLGLKHEKDPLQLDRTDKDGNPVIPENAHVRLANASTNDGAEILRRGYSYNDGVNFTAERWPPWRQGMEYDAGLFFLAYQRDPRSGFVRIFQNMAKFDMLNQFVTHVGGGLFACPPGARPGEFIGQRLFAAT